GDIASVCVFIRGFYYTRSAHAEKSFLQTDIFCGFASVVALGWAGTEACPCGRAVAFVSLVWQGLREMKEGNFMDKAKREQFINQMMNYVTGAALSGMIYIGDRVGLFKTMAGAGSLSIAETAAKAELQERYVREWLSAMAAAGIVEY